MEAEEAVGGEGPFQIVDAKSLKKLISTLERKYTQNVEQRIKHSQEPQRFLESEIELDEAVRAMTAVATSPELYPDLVTAGAVPTFISLLHHENGDIAAATIELLSELTDADAVEDSEAEAGVLIDGLLKGGLLEALVQRLQSLNESVAEEAAAVYNALSVIENATELRSEFAAAGAAHPGLLEWMIARLRPKAEADANKQYTAEVLGVLLQAGGESSRKKFIELNGVELMLRAVAPYKSREPETAEEEEFVENAFDVLCTVLMESSAKTAFAEADGAELMVLILKGRTAARAGALKCLDFATTGCPAACNQVVDFGGLGTVFSLFMGRLKQKGKNGKRKDESVAREEEERSVSIVTNLLIEVDGDARKARVAAKFAENEFEKCDRLIEIFGVYEERVSQGKSRLFELDDDENMDEDDILLSQLDAGLFTLHQTALIASELWVLGDVGVCRRLLALLHQRGRTLGSLRSVLLDRRATLAEGLDGEGEEKERGMRQIERTNELLIALGYKEEGEEGEKEGENQGNDAKGDETAEEVGGKRRREEEESEKNEGGEGADDQKERSQRQKTN